MLIGHACVSTDEQMSGNTIQRLGFVAAIKIAREKKL